jgi:hypothetical protein
MRRNLADIGVKSADAGSLHSQRRLSTAGSNDPLLKVRLPERLVLEPAANREPRAEKTNPTFRGSLHCWEAAIPLPDSNTSLLRRLFTSGHNRHEQSSVAWLVGCSDSTGHDYPTLVATRMLEQIAAAANKQRTGKDRLPRCSVGNQVRMRARPAKTMTASPRLPGPPFSYRRPRRSAIPEAKNGRICPEFVRVSALTLSTASRGKSLTTLHMDPRSSDRGYDIIP